MLKKRGSLTEVEIKYYVLQILKAVECMHKKLIIHRDLKLANIVIDSNMNIKIIDFGLAAQLKHPKQKVALHCGTPNYIAPEILDAD